MYCCRCGSYASQRVKGLKQVCSGKPTASKKYGLSRILAGKHPCPGKQWPGHEHDTPPFHFLKGGDIGRNSVVPCRNSQDQHSPESGDGQDLEVEQNSAEEDHVPTDTEEAHEPMAPSSQAGTGAPPVADAQANANAVSSDSD